jgi:DNA-binding LacI/PurR family transcriptional regulator
MKRRSLPEKIAESIRSDYLVAQKLQAGDYLPKVTELRERYSCSVNTIVSALSILEREELVIRKHGEGVVVSDGKAHSDYVGRKTIACIGPIAQGGIMLRIISGLEYACSKQGYRVLIVSNDNDYERECAQIETSINSGCEGIILYPAIRTRKQLQEDFLAAEFRETPMVLVDIAYPEQKRAQVVFDNLKAGYEMTRLLLNEGHRRIAFMSICRNDGEYLLRSNLDRFEGYRRALEEAGLAPEERYIWKIYVRAAYHRRGNSGSSLDHPAENLRGHLRRWLEEKDGERPTAVIALEDPAAVALTDMGYELGISVPGDLRVVGFDDYLGFSSYPYLPTTRPDFVRAGELAAETLFRQISNGLSESFEIHILPVPVVWREIPTISSRKE